jgi:hypothetical protein
MASFLVTIPDEQIADVTVALAASFGYSFPATPDPVDMTDFVQGKVAGLLQQMVVAVQFNQAREAAVAAVQTPANPHIVITSS